MARDYIANGVCVGNGVKVFFYINGEDLNFAADATDAEKTSLLASGLSVEVGILNDIMVTTQANVAPSYIAGDRNPIDIATGVRVTSGQVSFSSIDRGFIDYFINGVLKETSGLNTNVNLFNNSPTVFGGYYDKATYMVQNEIQYLDQLPPVDIILIATADHVNYMKKVSDSSNPNLLTVNADDLIGGIGDDFKKDAYYKLEIKGVRFLNSNFSFAAGAPMQDQVFDFVARSKTTWERIDN